MSSHRDIAQQDEHCTAHPFPDNSLTSFLPYMLEFFIQNINIKIKPVPREYHHSPAPLKNTNSPHSPPTLVPSSFIYNLLLCAPEGDAERVQCSSTTHLPSWAASRISAFTYRYLCLTRWEHDVFSRIHDAPYRVFASKEKGTGFTSAWACCGKQEAIPGTLANLKH